MGETCGSMGAYIGDSLMEPTLVTVPRPVTNVATKARNSRSLATFQQYLPGQ